MGVDVDSESVTISDEIRVERKCVQVQSIRRTNESTSRKHHFVIAIGELDGTALCHQDIAKDVHTHSLLPISACGEARHLSDLIIGVFEV